MEDAIGTIKSLVQMDMHEDALSVLQKRGTPEDYINTGAALLKRDQATMAASVLETALSMAPGHPAAMANLSEAYKLIGAHERALSLAMDTIRVHPTRLNISRGFLLCLFLGEDPSRELLDAWRDMDVPTYTDRPRPLSIDIRVGYLSHNMNAHSNASFLLPILRHHAPHIKPYVYSAGNYNDDTSRELGTLGKWRNFAGKSTDERGQYIRRDQLDILVHLDGHYGSGSDIIERQCAPLQVSYLGYPGPTYQAVDYRISDRTADPVDTGKGEPILYTDGPFLTFEALKTADITEREPGPVVFGSFNSWGKMSKACTDAWNSILDKTGGKLLLKARVFRDRAFAETVTKLFKGRAECRPITDTREEHMAMYNEVDIALDPHAYTGTTTTCEALHMGVPVITLAGSTPQARASAAVMPFPEWITDNIPDYIAKAVSLAGDLPNKHATAGRFQESSNPARLTASLEQIYQEIRRTQ